MSSQVSTLREIFVAELAGERSLAGVLPEVVSEIAWLFEHAPALRIHALEVQLLSLGLRVLDLDGLVPVRRNALEVLWRIFYLLALLVEVFLLELFFLKLGWLWLDNLFLFFGYKFSDDIFELCHIHVILHFRLRDYVWEWIFYIGVFDLWLVLQFAQNFNDRQLLLKKLVFVEILSDARHSFTQTAFWK
jgi:hypothetical protein